MIFPVNLKVLSQMLDPAGEKCDLHIRAAGIFVMQLELLEIHRLIALSHNEGPIVTEEPIFATVQHDEVEHPSPFSRCVLACLVFVRRTGGCGSTFSNGGSAPTP